MFRLDNPIRSIARKGRSRVGKADEFAPPIMFRVFQHNVPIRNQRFEGGVDGLLGLEKKIGQILLCAIGLFPERVF